MRLLRFERRIGPVRWRDAKHQIINNMALGMDELLTHIAPHAGFGDTLCRKSYVRSTLHLTYVRRRSPVRPAVHTAHTASACSCTPATSTIS